MSKRGKKPSVKLTKNFIKEKKRGKDEDEDIQNKDGEKEFIDVSYEEESDEDDDEDDKEVLKTSKKDLSGLRYMSTQDNYRILSQNPFPKHTKEKEALLDSYFKNGKTNELFNELLLGYNILLHGEGSKINLVKRFINEYTKKYPSIFVNAFLPNVDIKEIVDIISVKLFNNSKKYSTVNQQIRDLNTLSQEQPLYKHIFLIIYNIDGMALNSYSSQVLLSELAQIPNLHIIATIDNYNANLIWDVALDARFRWVRHSMPTYENYLKELLKESSVYTGKESSLTLSSIESVLKSLTDTAKDVLKILINHTMELKQRECSKRNLYELCFDEFLVSEESSLNSHLVEYIDHKMIREFTKHGETFLSVQMNKSLTKQVLVILEANTQE
ncbi:hypothetical protein CYY_006983 [Polysphondylium violaceum]|uniref:Origin recognition complex subunit 2 n=1 Tax=Polysphondylium violaceum TaxID=133409 RepID=A0A8J4V2M4_9MYCE|nr:hypothetical protein CYY_006983 [Polysphondylium violaceum]